MASTLPPHARPGAAWSSFLLGLAVGAVLLALALAPRIGHGPSPTVPASPAAEQDMDAMPGMAGSMSAHGPGGTHAEPAAIPGFAVVHIDARRQQLIGLKTGTVRRDKLVMAIRTVGIVEPDQTRQARIHVRVRGWITRVHANFVGRTVHRGEPLLDLYSPDLVTAEQELLVARKARSPGTPLSDDLYEAARQRLELYGVSTSEISALEKEGKVARSLTLRAPVNGQIFERNAIEGSYVEPANELYRIVDLSRVWIQARIYEEDRAHVEPGQKAEIGLPSNPAARLTGTVAFIEPIVDETTRTSKVRIEADNRDGLLVPGMFTDATIAHDMGEGLLIPDTGILDTGERTLAFRSLPEGRFEPVAVTVGRRFGDELQVLSGLAAGDRVVTSANFLVDSESQLKAVVTGGGGGHHH